MDYTEFSGKTIDDAVIEACSKFMISRDKLEYIVEDEGNSGFLGIGSKPAVIKARIKSGADNTAKDFLDEVFGAMGMEVKTEIKYDETEKSLDIELTGDNMGSLIGKRGQTLDALQYLVNLVVNKNTEEKIHVRIDTEDYRSRRRQTLENLAKNMASKVKRTHRQVVLEPMNPYERRVIHSTLQNDKFVTTHSEGEEPYRKVVIVPKKTEGYGDHGDRRGSYGRNNYRNDSNGD
ncbi:MAG: protein jag [Lachnospiraceae bacterium]|nr:protein jag [Lachnospiraceae bacterium]